MTGAAVVFLAFTADWCAPCKQLKRDCENDSDLHIISSEHSPDAVQYYRVKGYPTIVAVIDGEVVARKSGYQGRAELREWMADVRESVGQKDEMTPEQKSNAVRRLFAIRDMLDSLSAAFDDIVTTAKEEDASGLAFSAMMLQESIATFHSELSSFVMEKLSSE